MKYEDCSSSNLSEMTTTMTDQIFVFQVRQRQVTQDTAMTALTSYIWSSTTPCECLQDVGIAPNKHDLGGGYWNL